MTAEQFAYNEYRDYVTYRELAHIETVPAFKKILEELMQHELEDYQFWLQFSTTKTFAISRFELLLLKIMRRLLGLTFTAKFLELHEKEAIQNYTEFLQTAPADVKERIQVIIDHEMQHERELIGQIREEQVEFMGSIILGLNDGLIELTGALVGFTFAFRNHGLVALTGLITGIAAALSMAASAYMQARHEAGKDAKKAGLYTGLSYLSVVALLVLPFVFIPNIFLALGLMFGVIFSIITAISYYTAVLFERSFRQQFTEMVVFSLGVAAVAFLTGSALRIFIF